MKFAALLRGYREINRLSLRDCAKIIGLSTATLHRIESGKPVDGHSLLLLINWMFGDKNNKMPPDMPAKSNDDAVALWREALLSWQHCNLGTFIGANLKRINAVVS